MVIMTVEYEPLFGDWSLHPVTQRMRRVVP